MSRLFVALFPPESVRTELGALATPLAGVRWTPAENLHLTLRFIGETNPAREIAFTSALARVQVEPFVLPVAGAGLFPTRGPAKVLWAGVGDGHPRLYQLRKQVDEALLSVDPNLDVRHFHPHFTLARLGENHESKALRKFLDRQAGFEAPPFRVDVFHLLVSELSPGHAPVYRIRRSFPLEARPVAS